MSRRDAAWLADILTAIDAIGDYLAEGSLDQSVVYDACRVRPVEIGEAVKDPKSRPARHRPSHPVAGYRKMRGQLAHHYFDTDHAIVAYVVGEALTPLRTAIVDLARQATTPDADLRPDKPSTPPPTD